MHFRFRKSFDIFGRILRWTVSKRGVSLNFHLGPFSKSWGTRQNTTTMDIPGTSGMFLRKEKRKHHSSDPDVRDYEHHQAHRKHITVAIGFFFAVELVAELIRLNVHLGGESCTLSGHANLILLVSHALVLGTFLALRSQIRLLQGFCGLLLILGLCYLQWRLFGSIVGGHIHCHSG
jgi:hypothetical protein